MIDPEWDHVHRVLDRFEFMKHSRPSESSHEVLTNLRIENRLETSTRGSVLERESKSIPNIEWRTRWCKVVYLLYNWMGIEIRTCMYRSRSDTIRISTVIAGQKKTTTRKVFAWGYPPFIFYQVESWMIVIGSMCSREFGEISRCFLIENWYRR